jgi:hypothetical protein
MIWLLLGIGFAVAVVGQFLQDDLNRFGLSGLGVGIMTLAVVLASL